MFGWLAWVSKTFCVLVGLCVLLVCGSCDCVFVCLAAFCVCVLFVLCLLKKDLLLFACYSVMFKPGLCFCVFGSLCALLVCILLLFPPRSHSIALEIQAHAVKAEADQKLSLKQSYLTNSSSHKKTSSARSLPTTLQALLRSCCKMVNVFRALCGVCCLFLFCAVCVFGCLFRWC